MSRFAVLPLIALTACTDDTGTTDEELTSATAKEVRVAWTGYVYAAVGDSDAAIQKQIQKQVKSAIGALRQPQIGIQGRDALGNIDPAKWTRETLDVIDVSMSEPKRGQIVRVRYPYSDVGLVKKTWTATTLQLPLLFGDYVSKAAKLKPPCSDDQKTEADSLWFHYTPQQAACKSAIQQELDALNSAQKGLDPAKQVSAREVGRDFLTVRATLQVQKAPPTKYPE
jgi:hypothetical protein